VNPLYSEALQDAIRFNSRWVPVRFWHWFNSIQFNLIYCFTYIYKLYNLILYMFDCYDWYLQVISFRKCAVAIVKYFFEFCITFILLFVESELWNTPLMTFSKEAITKPLTTLPSLELEQEALKLFKVNNYLTYHVFIAIFLQFQGFCCDNFATTKLATFLQQHMIYLCFNYYYLFCSFFLLFQAQNTKFDLEFFSLCIFMYCFEWLT